VPVSFINHENSPGLRRGGILNVIRHSIDILCTIDAIPERVVVDLNGLEIGDSIHIEAVTMPEGVRPALGSRDSTIASVAASSAVREEALAAAQTAATAPEEGEEEEEAAAAPAAPAAEA
jgi:large subunit ribosomal protein L25